MVNVKISEQTFKKLKIELFKDSPRENATFLLTGVNHQKDQFNYLIRRMVKIPEQEFNIKNELHLSINQKVIHGIIRLSEVNNLGLAICHSHPNSHGKLKYSPSDDFGELRISRYFFEILPDKPIISLLFGENDIIGRVWMTSSSKPKPIDRITVLGSKIEKIKLLELERSRSISEGRFDRQILALGKAGQRQISHTKIGIVGVGGTGSLVAEQLTRLGVKNIVIIDKDDFEESNITRMYGSVHKNKNKHMWFYSKKQQSKVNIVGKHLKQINPNIVVTKVKSNVVSYSAANKLLDRDIIFSCTDDHWGRSIINQMAYQFMIPVINIGVRIDTKNGSISAGTVVIHLIGPDKPCLWCYGYLNPDIISAESMNKKDRHSLIREGYVQDLDTKAPSVITFTSIGSSIGVNLFLHLVTGYQREYGNITSLRYDILFGDIRRCTTSIKHDCVCRNSLAYGTLRSLNTIKNNKLILN